MSAWLDRPEGTRKQSDIGFHLTGSFQWLSREHELAFGITGSKQDLTSYTYESDNTAPISDFNAWDGSYPEPNWGARSIAIDTTTKQTGFYAASRLSLTESIKVIMGGRIANWKQTGKDWNGNLDFGDTGVFIPYAGTLYDFNDAHTAYASYTEIFKPQNRKDRNGNYLDPLTGKSYEVGLKSAFFGDALNTTVALFKIDQDNLAQPDTGYFVPNTTPPTEAFRAAQGEVSKGFELEMIGELLLDWNVSVSYTHFVAEDATGQAVNTNYPRKLLKLFSTYRFPGNWKKLTFGGGINWEGSNYTNVTNPITEQPERLEQEAYTLVNMMARYDISEALSAQLNVDNFLDETYYSQIGTFTQLAYGKPRNITLNMKYQF